MHAGKVGFCNHALALMSKVCKFSFYGCTDVSDLASENDVNSSQACCVTARISFVSSLIGNCREPIRNEGSGFLL